MVERRVYEDRYIGHNLLTGISPFIPQPLRNNATVSKLGMISQTYVLFNLGLQSPNSAVENRLLKLIKTRFSISNYLVHLHHNLLQLVYRMVDPIGM